jgi:hypothetical protein
MAWTFDPTTDRGRVRLLIGDDDTSNQIFQDASIDAFLSMEGGEVKLGAAAAIEAIAAKQALIQKVMKIGDVTTDGAKLAQALRELAANFRRQVEEAPAFDIAEWTVTPAVEREIILKDALRDLT